jgi:hypothetical protein
MQRRRWGRAPAALRARRPCAEGCVGGGGRGSWARGGASQARAAQRELEAAQLRARELEREARQAAAPSVGQGLEAQLQRMCEDALAKQALLEQAAAPCTPPRGAGASRGRCGARRV